MFILNQTIKVFFVSLKNFAVLKYLSYVCNAMNLMTNKKLIVMKRTFVLLAALMFAGIAFSQGKIETKIIYNDEELSDPESYDLYEIIKPSGEKGKTIAMKHLYFKEENRKGLYVITTASTTDELVNLINEHKQDDMYVKEMYEDEGLYYILFSKAEAEKE